ncbi:MAG: hypothetical protein QOI38_879 [Sphingomonadales bacterium]|jgi:hypothetical protein|nr:hypothetical protein [Sphingomonadales bacterium]
MSKRIEIGLAALLIGIGLSGCGGEEAEADPAALDQAFNQIIANDQAERRRLVEEARDREEVREREMEQRAAGYDGGNSTAAANAAKGD